MSNLSDFLRTIRGKNIHIVGVSGAEGSSVLSLLTGYGLSSLTAHDFIEKTLLEKNFKIWHKGLSVEVRNKYYRDFQQNISFVNFNDRYSYLKGIDKADLIFVPQSWRLYPQNKRLHSLKEKGIPFYSLTRIYLDFAPARIIVVTGTVGKGSVANLIFEILKRNNKRVYFGGNETWRLQLADELLKMTPEDYLVLEISHRQLMDGFTRAPYMTVFTNLFPNHLDELTFKQYGEVKISLVKNQLKDQISIINYDNEILRGSISDLRSKLIYYSIKKPEMNLKVIQPVLGDLENMKTGQFNQNILASATAAVLLGIPVNDLLQSISGIPALPARLEKLGKVNGVNVYDDVKSTTPWATLAALEKLSGKVVLIIGGDTKGINYDLLVKSLRNKNIEIIALKSPLSDHLLINYPKLHIYIRQDLEQALRFAQTLVKKEGNIVVSPAAANFYSYFIKGKKSLRKIFKYLEGGR